MPVLLVGAPRIELGPHAPETCVLPLYDAPLESLTALCLPLSYQTSTSGATKESVAMLATLTGDAPYN